MPKSSRKHSSRRRQIHLFETPQFKAELKRSIKENLDKMVQEGFTFPTHLPLEQLLAPCKKTRGKKGRITRPQNAFILYRKDLQEKIKHENPQADFKEISRIAGNNWRDETDQVKNNYTLLATLGGLVHQDLFPNYKYQPRQKDDRKSIEEEEEIEEEIEDISLGDRTNKPWESMPQIFNNNSEVTQGFSSSVQESILTSPLMNIGLEHPVISVMNLIESPYYEPSISLNHSPKNEPPDDELNCYKEFQIDDHVIDNLNLNNGFLSPLNRESIFNNDNINSPEDTTNEEINELDILPTVNINSYDIQPETTQSPTYIPVTTQVNTTIPSFYTSIIDNIAVYGEQLAPILATSSGNYNPIQSDHNSIDQTSYDMEFLDEWRDEEIIVNLYQP